MELSKPLGLKEVDRVEVISLVDNTVDFLSSVTSKQARLFGQWTKERYGQEWVDQHNQYPFAEHGFSMLARIFEKEKSTSVLFDTGNSPGTVVENANRMGINLDEIDTIVLSHGHYDHFGGLISTIKAIGKKLPVIVHEDMFKIRGSARTDSTISKYKEFPTNTQISPAYFISTKKPFLLADDGVCVTGEIPRKTKFEKGIAKHRAFINGIVQLDPLILDDRALLMNVKKKGLVIISGCAHAGIINTISYAKEISAVSSIYAILGGFHLAGTEKVDRIQQTIIELKRFKPKLIAPSHCTGWKAMTEIATALPEAFVWNSVGFLYEL